jgi:hypothetical protein
MLGNLAVQESGEQPLSNDSIVCPRYDWSALEARVT